MTAIRNNRLAVAAIRMARRLRLVESEAARRHAIAEAARALVHGPPMTEDEKRQHGEAVAAVRRADEAKRQAG